MRPSVKKVSSILSTIYFVVLLVLRLLEQHMWVWLGIALPIIVSFGFFGLLMAFRPQAIKSNPSKKKRMIFSSLFLGVSVVFLVLTVLMIIGILPYPILDIEFDSD